MTTAYQEIKIARENAEACYDCGETVDEYGYSINLINAKCEKCRVVVSWKRIDGRYMARVRGSKVAIDHWRHNRLRKGDSIIIRHKNGIHSTHAVKRIHSEKSDTYNTTLFVEVGRLPGSYLVRQL